MKWFKICIWRYFMHKIHWTSFCRIFGAQDLATFGWASLGEPNASRCSSFCSYLHVTKHTKSEVMAIQSWIEMLLLQLKGSAEKKPWRNWSKLRAGPNTKQYVLSGAKDLCHQRFVQFSCPLPRMTSVSLPVVNVDIWFHTLSRFGSWGILIILDVDLYNARHYL